MRFIITSPVVYNFQHAGADTDRAPTRLAADSTSYCEARYVDGRRDYVLRDTIWGGMSVAISAVAMPDEEVAVWRFTTTGTEAPLTIQAISSPVRARQLHRNGDLGVDAPDSFEPCTDEPADTITWTMTCADTFYLAHTMVTDSMQAPHTPLMNVGCTRQYENEFSLLSLARHFTISRCPTRYSAARTHLDTLSRRVTFTTPDAFINTLGSALTIAADGLWDGQTWLHGCIGWRMPLPGWRAAYVGDVLGWADRAVTHFNAYAASQVTDVPAITDHPTQDSLMNIARAERRWGTPMYSNGYICRNPGRNDQMNHYDMNLSYVDELLWHFCYDADTAYMRRMWPVLTRHAAWEKRNYDPDGDGLYDAYCCIWASDALYYSGGAVTHSSAYNYRCNNIMARIATMIGEDPRPYRQEADHILAAMNSRLWITDDESRPHHWAEYIEAMGYRRRHDAAALWSVYTPIDCGAGTPEQCYSATRYVDNSLPHIPVGADTLGGTLCTLSTSNWMPYAWSINNVAPAEVMHTALAYWQAGRPDTAYRLLLANILDQMYMGRSPANFGQLSYLDAARGECYRDFGDCIGISARTLVQGLFGIVPDAMAQQCIVRPGFPAEWDSAAITTPYLSYNYRREGDNDVYTIEQHFAQPLTIIVRQNLDDGHCRDIVGTNDLKQTIIVKREDGQATVGADSNRALSSATLSNRNRISDSLCASKELRSLAGASNRISDSLAGARPINIDTLLNADVPDIFRNRYLSPRPLTTTLQIPIQGVGEWCHPHYCPQINDSVFRSMVIDDTFTMVGIPFRTHAEGHNIAYTSLFDNYPDSIVLTLPGTQADALHFLLAGSTNHMQSRIDNGIIVATYDDATSDTLHLINPDNWCPIEQDYYDDGRAFSLAGRPWRVSLATGIVSRHLGRELGIDGVDGREIPGGAAQMLTMPLTRGKRLAAITVKPLSPDIVIGLMALTVAEK